MFPATAALVDAYRDTDYITRGATVAIGVWHPATDRLLGRYRARTGVFVTACNPHGRRASPAVNVRRGRRLKALVTRLGLRAVPGIGVGRTGDWPPEPGLLVFGTRAALARMIGRRFNQNAVVLLARRHPAALAPLR